MSLEIFVLLCFVANSFQLDSTKAENCNPNPNPEKPQYIIGYGTLINPMSKNLTYPSTGISIPVSIKGYQRSLTAKKLFKYSLSSTSLGADVAPNSQLNAVIFSVPNATAIAKFDARERFYCRVLVAPKNVKVLRGLISDNGTFPQPTEMSNAEFWIYLTKPNFRHVPNANYPIVQSYVDMFILGCIQVEKQYELNGFADQCVTQTLGWKYPWVNDRVYPRRPQPDSLEIDMVIGRNLPDYPKQTYTERHHIN